MNTDNISYLGAKIGIILTIIVSLLKINALEDIMHGVYTAIGGLMVTSIYALIKYVWHKKHKK